MLKAEAKQDYQREYMRRKRAGEPTRREKPEREYPARFFSDVCHWAQCSRPWTLKASSREIIADLVLKEPKMEDGDNWDIEDWCRRYREQQAALAEFARTDPAWQEALRRYKALKAKAKQQAKQKHETKRKATRYCVLCMEPASPNRLMFGADRDWVVCEECVAQASAAFAEVKARRAQ